jgi:hypothetical protein
MFLDTRTFFSIESYYACLNITRAEKKNSNYMDKRLPCLYVHGYCKIVNVSKNSNLHYSQVVWLECTPCMIIFSHNKLMATYKKLTPSLQFLPLFNYNWLLFVMCFFLYTKDLLIHKKKITESCFACLNVTKVDFFLKTWQEVVM